MSLNKLIGQIQRANFQKEVLDYKFAAKNLNNINLQDKNRYSNGQAIEMKKSFLSTKAPSQIDISKHRYHKQILQDQKEQIKIFGYSSSQILQHFKKKQNLKNKHKNSQKIKASKQNRNNSCTQYKLQDFSNQPKHQVRFQRRFHHKLSLNQLQKAANTKNPLPNQLRKQYFTQELFQFHQGRKQNFRIQCNSKAFTKYQQGQYRQNGLKSMSHFCHQNKNKSKITFQSTHSHFYSTALGFKKQSCTVKKSAEQQLKDKLQKIKFNNNFGNQIEILRKKQPFQKQEKPQETQMIQYKKETQEQVQKEGKKSQKLTNQNQNQVSLQMAFNIGFVSDIKPIRKLFQFLQKIPFMNQKYEKHVDLNNTHFSIEQELCLLQSQTTYKKYSIFVIDIETLDIIILSSVEVKNKRFSFKNKSFIIKELLDLAFKQKTKNSVFHVLITEQNSQGLLFQGFFLQKDIHFFSGRQTQLIFFTYYLRRFLAFDPNIKNLFQVQQNTSLLLQTELSIPLEFVKFAQTLQKNIVIESPSNKNVVKLSSMLLQCFQTVILIKKQIYQNFNWRGISLKKEETQFKTYNFQHFYI